jgi:hypothetical protein
MIAKNFRKHADAMALQLVLAFGKPVWNTSRPTSRIGRALRSAQAALVKQQPQLVAWVTVQAPQWYTKARRASKNLAKAVKTACRSVFELQGSMR